VEIPLKERVGKLTMGTVNNLADDPDEIITTLKGIDFGKQDLDILIELSKQIKTKRVAMFPDTNYMGQQQTQSTPD
jgi:hypothetical protein